VADQGESRKIGRAIPGNMKELRLGFWKRLMPIIIVQIYLSFTVFLFEFGPWKYPFEDKFWLYAFLASAQAALFLGYLFGIRREPRGYGGRWKIPRLALVSAVISLALYAPTALWRVGTIFPQVGSAVRDLGAAYAEHGFGAVREGSLVVVEYIRIVCGPFLAMVLPLTVFYWDELSRSLRLMGLLSVAGTVAITISMGTNKMLADTVGVTVALLVASLAAKRIKVTLLKKAGLVLFVVAAMIGMALFFGATQLTRRGPATMGLLPGTDIKADYDNFLVKELPEKGQSVILGVCSYISHGYFGLYATMQQPFVPMFGIGNSIFLCRHAYRITGNEVFLKGAYPFRISYVGWSAENYWFTIYPWIASDVSFPGTIIIVFFLGQIFALSWLDTLRGDNPFAVAFFGQMTIVFMYFPANNQCLQYGEGFFAFFTLLGFWLFTRRKSRRATELPLSATRKGGNGDGV